MRDDASNRVKLPYPWTAGDGLARILDDPPLWTDVFEDSPFRDPLEASLRRIRRTRPWSAGTEVGFGALLCDVLRRPVLRRQVSEDLRAHAAPEHRGLISLSTLLGLALLQYIPGDRRLGPPFSKLLDAAFAAQIAAPAPDDFGRMLQVLPPETSPSLGPLLAAALALMHRSAAACYAEAVRAHDPAAHVRIAATPTIVPILAPSPTPARRRPPPVRRTLAVVRPPAEPQRPPEPVADRTTAQPLVPPAPAEVHASTTPSEVHAFTTGATEQDALRAAALCTALADNAGENAAACLTIDALKAAITTLCEPATSDPARAVHACLGDDLDALMAALWHHDERCAVIMCARVPAEGRLFALAGCGFVQIQQAASASRELAVAAAASLLVAALQSDDAESLAYLDPCLGSLPPACVEFLQGIRWAARRGEPGETLHALVQRPDEPAGSSPAGLAARRVRELIAGTPGMSGHFHRLRMTAHRKYIAPLAPFATDDQAQPALAHWRSAGTLEDKLAACITDQPDGVRLGLESVHVEKTRQYLQQFERLLRDWGTGTATGSDGEVETPLAAAWDALRHAAPRNPTCERLVQVVETAARDIGDAMFPPEIGKRWAPGAGHLVRAPHASLSPLRFHSWLMRSAGKPVPLAVFIADGVRRVLGKGPQTLAEAVGVMLSQQDFRAARTAADGTSLADEVGAAAEHAIAVLRDRYAGEIAAAEAERQPGDELDDSLTLLTEAFASYELDGADMILQMLAGQIRSVQRRRDPAWAPAAAFLRALGQEIADDERSETLRTRVDAQRELHVDQRWHILALRHAAEQSPLPGPLCSTAAALADALDQPQKWPTERVAQEIHDDLEELFRYVGGQLRDTTSSDASTLGITVSDRLAALVDGARSGDRTLAAVVAAIREYRSLAEVLRRIDPRLASSRAGILAHAWTLYREEQWQLARNLLAATPPRDQEDDHVLRACVELAHCLWDNSALDVDWTAVQRHAGWLRDHDAVPEVVRCRATRMAELSALLGRVTSHRLVDELANPDGQPDPRAAQAALLVLLLQLRQAELCRGAAEAVTAALAMPEQIFRVWARWALDLDYGNVPADGAHLWRIVEREWDPQRSVVFRPPPSTGPFPSFRCFALFVQAKLLHAGPGTVLHAPERSFGELQRALGLLRMRNDGAHASFRPSVDQRRQFFALIHRWLERLFEVCPGGGGMPLRDELATLLGPLMQGH